MRSKKRYTNATFTKRVDHKAGRHHTARAPGEPAVCESCGAQYANRRWIAGGTHTETHEQEQWRPARLTVCPACRQEQSGSPRGYVQVDGAFAITHRDEIERLLRNEEERASVDNPLGRIMNWREDQDSALTIATTTDHLAQRLGHALEKAFGGKVHYSFSHENKLTRVKWSRD